MLMKACYLQCGSHWHYHALLHYTIFSVCPCCQPS